MKIQLAAALALSAAIILVCGGTNRALAAAAQPSDHPNAAEATFVAKATADLQRMYCTTAQAAAAGYYRYTD